MMQNVRFSLRTLKKSPSFTAVAVLTLALGIGANTAIFSVINALTLRLLPVRDPNELVQLVVHGTRRGVPYTDRRIDFEIFEAVRARNQVFTDVIYEGLGEATARSSHEGTAKAQFATANYFSVLGLSPAAGRFFSPEDDREGAPNITAVISDSLWSRLFRRDPRAIGGTITVEDVPVTIIGVAPRHFEGIDPGEPREVWCPLSASRRVFQRRVPMQASKNAVVSKTIARLRPGVNAQQAQANADVIFRAEVARLWPPNQFPEADREEISSQHVGLESAEHGTDFVRDQFQRPLLLTMAAVAVVLLIACMNVANLLLARFASRASEISVRLALGARMRHIMAQVLTESILLSLLGGAAGLLLAFWGAQLVTKLMASGYVEIAINPRPDLHVLGFTFAIALLAGVAFGVAPAWRAARIDVGSVTSRASRDLSGSGGSRRLSRLFIALQVALSIVLITAAGLLARTLHNLSTFDAGFEGKQVALFAIRPPAGAVSVPQLAIQYEELRERLEQLPGVHAASFSINTPASGGAIHDAALIPGSLDAAHEIDCVFNIVGPRFFAALGTPLLRGRDFTQTDTETSSQVVIINQSLARRYFGDRDPIGEQLTRGLPGQNLKQYRVVGMVTDARYEDLRQPPSPEFFEYLPQQRIAGRTGAWFELETSSPVEALERPIERIAHEVDPRLEVLNLRPLSEQINRSLYQERAIASLSSSFATLALVLVAVGLYGSLAYMVERRTKELGVRMALGAQPQRLRLSVIRSSIFTAVLGLILGLPLALLAAKLISAQLFGVTPADPLTLIASSLLLIAVAFLAAYAPARRATQVDPAIALRAE